SRAPRGTGKARRSARSARRRGRGARRPSWVRAASRGRRRRSSSRGGRRRRPRRRSTSGRGASTSPARSPSRRGTGARPPPRRPGASCDARSPSSRLLFRRKPAVAERVARHHFFYQRGEPVLVSLEGFYHAADLPPVAPLHRPAEREDEHLLGERAGEVLLAARQDLLELPRRREFLAGGEDPRDVDPLPALELAEAADRVEVLHPES